MNATLDIRAILDATANQILAVVAPDTARLVRAYVSLDEEADTAATDGVRIWVPPIFEGVDVAHDTLVAVGLLVHELGHFLQPLKALEQAEQETAAPHWLGNIVADVQLEAMMAGLFPPLADTLVAVRTTVKTARLTEYTTAILKGRHLADAACSVALAGRFCRPATPFDDSGESGSPLWGALNRHADPALTTRMTAFAWRLSEAQSLAPDELPDHVRQIMTEFPELSQAPARHAIPGGGLTVIGPAGQAAQAEAAANTGAHPPAVPAPVAAVRAGRTRARPEAQQAARGLRMHFQVARSATAIVAPDRLDRRAAALGELVPLRMALPGKERPRPKVAICLDKSGSMKGAKFVLAQTAAQAVALAVREANGEVVGILFDDSAQAADTGDAALLFSEPDSLSYGGTAFEFLADAWRRWPSHVILLVTDGDGSIPLALPGDKARTSAILIPPDCDPGAMSQIAARVVTLGDLRGLADVLALLTPRT